MEGGNLTICAPQRPTPQRGTPTSVVCLRRAYPQEDPRAGQTIFAFIFKVFVHIISRSARS